MTMPSLIWGSPQWMAGALVLMGRRGRRAPLELRPGADEPRPSGSARAILKALGFTALALSLLEPLLTGSRPRRGANAFVILADNSQSLLIRDDETARTRGEWLRDLLRQGVPPGRRGSGRISTSAATSSTRTSARSTASTP